MKPHPSPSTRRGLTLIELLLVLALLVVIGALLMPSAGRMLSRQRIRGGADMVRVEWAKARVQAMKSGRIHVFRYEIGGPNFRTEFWEADDTAIEAGDASGLDTPQEGRTDLTLDDGLTYQLPEGVRFFFGQAEEDARSLSVTSQLEETNNREIAWSPPILFYSDGTCSGAEVTLTNDDYDAITLNLRGLTGIVQVGPLIGLEESPTASSQSLPSPQR